MNNIITIVKKELKRFFTDKRMVFSLIFPGILIFIMYSLMGNFMFQTDSNDDYEYKIYTINEPQYFTYLFESLPYNITFEESSMDKLDEIKEEVTNKEADLIIVYDEDFLADIQNNVITDLAIYQNSSSDTSTQIYSVVNAVFVSYEESISNVFNVVQEELADEADVVAMLLSSMLPMLLMMFLFNGSMAITTESIAGEKERGTISTLLVTPIKRREIALGKIIALSLTSLVAATSSFLGVMLSLPNLLGNNLDMSVSMYKTSDYILLFLLIMVMVVLFVMLLSIVSTFAKSVKESQQLAMPIMVIVLVCGLSPMILTQINSDIVYFIPIINAVMCFTDVFSMDINYQLYFITLVINIVIIVIGVYSLSKMFNSEKIMLNS